MPRARAYAARQTYPLRRLYERREADYEALKAAYLERRAEGEPDASSRKRTS